MLLMKLDFQDSGYRKPYKVKALIVLWLMQPMYLLKAKRGTRKMITLTVVR